MRNSYLAAHPTLVSKVDMWRGDSIAGELYVVNQRAGADTRKGAAMPKPDKTGRENAAEKSGGKSQGGGRANAPGQNKLRLFEHEDTGEEVTATMRDFHSTLKGQGYRPVDEAEESDTPAVDETTEPQS